MNFVIVYLGDNDFGNKVKEGLLNPLKPAHLMTEDRWKTHLISFLVGKSITNRNETPINFERARQLEQYLDSKLKVKLSKELPKKLPDHDNGSACLDLNRLYAWTF